MEQEMKQMQEEKKKNKQIILDLQDKIRKLDPDTSLADLKDRISRFLKNKIGS